MNNTAPDDFLTTDKVTFLRLLCFFAAEVLFALRTYFALAPATRCSDTARDSPAFGVSGWNLCVSGTDLRASGVVLQVLEGV